jgi:hypothetical protein
MGFPRARGLLFVPLALCAVTACGEEARLYLQLGHSDRVTSVTFSPDGRWTLTGGDIIARLRDVASGREIRRFQGHSSRVTSVAFSPDGLLARTGSWDATVRLWDIATGPADPAIPRARQGRQWFPTPSTMPLHQSHRKAIHETLTYGLQWELVVSNSSTLWWRSANSFITFLARIFERAAEQDFRLASALFKLLFLWTGVLFLLIGAFYLLNRMNGMLAPIPPVIKVACLFLIAFTVLMMSLMARERKEALQAHDRFLAVLDEFGVATDQERATGLSQGKMANIRRKAGALTGAPKEWWHGIEGSMELYTSPNGGEGWFITRNVPECLLEEDLVDSFYDATFHRAVPGILTALGLMATFVAILMALAGVSYDVRDPIRPVSGIDQLINGLSGKFLSSIIALMLSVICTFYEKKICDRQLRDSYHIVVKRAKNAFPLLTQSRIMLDIQRIAIGHAREGAAPEHG